MVRVAEAAAAVERARVLLAAELSESLDRGAVARVDALAGASEALDRALVRLSHVVQMDRNASAQPASSTPAEHSCANADVPVPRDHLQDEGPAALPRFVRDGDDLVKIGRSAKGDSTYEHRVPAAHRKVILDRLAGLLASRRRFTAEDVLMATREAGVESLPKYQLHACLGWLKSSGLVVQHGRRSYACPIPSTFASVVASAWDQLPDIGSEVHS